MIIVVHTEDRIGRKTSSTPSAFYSIRLKYLNKMRKKFALVEKTCVIYTRICLTTCIFQNEIKDLPIAANVLLFTALVASSRHGPDIEAHGSLENPERRDRDPDGSGDSGARGMHKETAGHFRGADRFP